MGAGQIGITRLFFYFFEVREELTQLHAAAHLDHLDQGNFKVQPRIAAAPYQILCVRCQLDQTQQIFD